MTVLDQWGTWARGNGLQIVLLVLGSTLLARAVRWCSVAITDRFDARSDSGDAMTRSELAKHRHVLAQVLSGTVMVIAYTVTCVLVVELLGVPLAGFVAPATVAGVALGFGAQRVVQDLLAGFFVIAERQYGFGDLLRISVIGVPAPVLGTVEDVTLRVTTLRSTNGEVVITPNGQIVQVTNLSRDWARAVIDVPIAATADVTKVSGLLKAVGLAAFEDDELHPLLLDAPSVMGVESIEVDQFKIRLVARTLPGKQFEVSRALRMRITSTLSQAGINLPTGLDTAAMTSSAAADPQQRSPHE